jgi:hypothetical protein
MGVESEERSETEADLSGQGPAIEPKSTKGGFAGDAGGLADGI